MLKDSHQYLIRCDSGLHPKIEKKAGELLSQEAHSQGRGRGIAETKNTISLKYKGSEAVFRFS